MLKGFFLSKRRALHWVLDDPMHREMSKDAVDYFNFIRPIKDEFPVEKIDFKSLNMTDLKETFETHQQQQLAIEKCFRRRKKNVLKRKENPDYSETTEIYEENRKKPVVQLPPTQVDINDKIAREAYTPPEPEKELVTKWFPEIKAQVLGEDEKAEKWKAMMSRTKRGFQPKRRP